MGKVLILISCSREKTTENGEFEKQIILDSVPQFRNELIETRRNIKHLIQNRKVEDRELKEGNRGDRLCNKNLIEGPDLGKKENRKPVYFPAYKRYIGRFFACLKEEDWLNAKRNGYYILILSGLYGFLSFEDSIQNYDCHLTDTIKSGKNINENRPARLKDYWEGILTDILKEYIENNKIELVLDLLSEASYQYTIRWEEIYELPVKVLHRVFKEKAGPDILPNLGLFVKNDIFPLPSERILNSDIIRPGQPIQRNYFEDEDILYFEKKIGELEDVAREPLMGPEIDKEMEKIFGVENWRILTENEKYSIKEGEFLYWQYKKGNLKTPSSIIAPWQSSTESVKKRFLENLFKTLQKKKINRISLPRGGEKIKEIIVDNYIKEKEYITLFEIELLMSYCDYENCSEKIRKITEIIKEIIKDHSLFSLFKEGGPVFKQRNIRNKIIHSLISDKEEKEDALLEEFRRLFLNKETSIVISYLKLIKELLNQH